MFPSPPSPPPVVDLHLESTVPLALRQAVDATYGSSIRDLRGSDSLLSLPDDVRELRQHSRELYNEEESWYYYLTEVALRRISNRIVNTFYSGPRSAWMKVRSLLPVALEFEAQISAWSANLPPSMQHYDSLSPVASGPTAFPTTSSAATDQSSASMELSWATDNRILEMRSWLYQPFLYYAIHQDTMTEDERLDRAQLTPSQERILYDLVHAGIDCLLKTLEVRSLRHRHHGVWFDLRAVVTAVVILFAAARSGAVQVPNYLFDLGHSHNWPTGAGVAGQEDFFQRSSGKITFSKILERLRFWEDEAPDIARARVLLEKLIAETRDIIARRQMN